MFAVVVQYEPSLIDCVGRNTSENINKKKIDFESLKIPKKEEIKKNYSYFYKLPCFAFLVDKKEKQKSCYYCSE